MTSQPSKRTLVGALNKCQTTLKRQTNEILELRQKLEVCEAVACAKAGARVASAWLGSDEYTELKAMLAKVLERLPNKQ
jgi:hypothetical protein